jgi:large subunit ribosomal protein L25
MSDVLQVVSRADTGTRASRKARRAGMVPAVLYGHGEECVNLAARREDLEMVVRHSSRTVELQGAVSTSALIRELQWDTYGLEPVHVDFLRVDASERIRVKVPVELRGECPGLKAGGVIKHIVHEVEIECTAASLPEKIFGHVGHLDLGGAIKLHDLEIPAGVELVTHGDDLVASCTLPGQKLEEQAAAGPSEPELIGRKADELDSEADES